MVTGSILVLAMLAACNTETVTQDIRPAVTVGDSMAATDPAAQPGEPTQSANALAPAQTAAPAASAGLAPSDAVTFLPVVGPPQSAVNRLSAAVRNSARTNALTIVPNDQPGARYQVKGYFSALDDGSGTRFVFIWDILDAQGRNLHRISGEERTTKRGADPWAVIDQTVIDRMVSRTMISLRGWMESRA